ncbi:hypothetical protein CY35_10G033100 [Sphagnum magellanicum]|nr:hypothetical protein CY35_10G033100 [Sphagnum magellanicum]KAH9549709.1 hypothetical protein CY35_10G033100 [Sphagnum magellanicum]
MAATHRLETTTSNSIDGSAFTGLSGHRSFSSTLEKSVSIRDGPSEGRVMVLGGGKPSVASQNGELQPTTQVLLDNISIDLKPHHLDLRRVINAATGALTDDPQSRPLKACGFEELKRLRQCLLENEKQARLRVKQLNDAMAKLNKVQNMLQSRKRSRPEPSTQERASLAVATGRMTTASHAKVSSSTVSNHVSTADISGASRAGDKNKSANPSKRIRTSMADLEGRPSNLSVQRPSSLQERERDMSRPSSSLALPVEEKERMPPGTNQVGEKVKLKGRRSSVKSEVSPAAVANGMSDGDRDHKWSAQHRLSLDSSRSRPSEGHGYRSGPVHGITSIHKAEVSAQANGLNMRGLNKGDSDGVISVGERGDRSAFSERERTTPKNEVRASPREEAHPASLPIVTKAKSARAPRSSSVSGTNPSGHLSRTSPLLEASDRPSVGTPPTKAQLLPGPSQRKRPAPSRSSSPPVAQWGSQRPQKPRQARRANLNPPVGILIPSRDDGNGAGESGTESDDSDKDGEKAKDKNKKVVPELGETKMVNSSQKTGSVFSSTNKSHVTVKEEGSQGDGVRRQGRTGRGSATPRVVTPVIAAPPETCDVVPANAKQLRSARGTSDVKPNRPGRPPLKKDAVDRKPATRRRESSGLLLPFLDICLYLVTIYCYWTFGQYLLSYLLAS